MSEQFWTQISAAVLFAIFALQLLDRLLPLVRSKRENGSGHGSLERPVEFWEKAIAMAVAEGMRQSNVRVLHKVDELLKDTASIRGNLHDIRDRQLTPLVLQTQRTSDKLDEVLARVRES